jgi:excinuclease ABC subunit C
LPKQPLAQNVWQFDSPANDIAVGDKEVISMLKPVQALPICESFGPSALAPQTIGESTTHALPSEIPAARQLLREHCPTEPGVYGWLNGDGQLIYVGKSKTLKHRLLSYFAKTPSDPKMERIRRQARSLMWEPLTDELLALLREQELIYRWRPEFNSQGQPNKRQPGFVAISNTAAPHAIVTKSLTAKCLYSFGPILGTKDLRHSVVALNLMCHLRDCSDQVRFEFGQQLQLFDESQRALCLRHELGSCPGPCRGLCTRQRYQVGLERALRFLRGDSDEILLELEQKMAQASSAQHYELAGVYRDRHRSLERLVRQLRRVQQAEQTIHGILPVKAQRGRDIWLFLCRGRLLAHRPRPQTPKQRLQMLELLEQLPRQQHEPTTHPLDIQMQLIIAAYFRKHRQTAARLIDFEAAKARLAG